MSREYLLPESGNDYKANLHCHTTLSDGKFEPTEVKKAYTDHGYSIIAFTDHDVFIPHPELCDEHFLALNGFEMEIYDDKIPKDFILTRTTHLNFIALDKNIDCQPFFHRTRYFIGNGNETKKLVKFDESQPDYVREYTPEAVNSLMKSCKEKGFFVTYNHPRWSLENYEVYSKYSEMNALEIMNGSCVVEGFIEHDFQAYDDLLMQNKKIGVVAGDDNHIPADQFHCWTVIRAKDLSYESVADALKNGDFYATSGPLIKEMYVEDGKLNVTTSDAKSIVFTTAIRHAKNVYDPDGKTVCAGSFEIGEYDRYVRVTVFGTDGTVAYSNPYYVND